MYNGEPFACVLNATCSTYVCGVCKWAPNTIQYNRSVHNLYDNSKKIHKVKMIEHKTADVEYRPPIRKYFALTRVVMFLSIQSLFGMMVFFVGAAVVAAAGAPGAARFARINESLKPSN